MKYISNLHLSAMLILFILFFITMHNSGVRAQEKIVFNDTIDWTWPIKNGYDGNSFCRWHNAPKGIINLGDMPSDNWKSPYDYQNGTFYLRFEVISQPTANPFSLVFGIWQDLNIANPPGWSECVSGVAKLSGGAGSSVETSIGSPSLWYQRCADRPVDFTRPEDFDLIGLVLWKGNAVCIPMAQGWTNASACSDAIIQQTYFFPMRAKITVVAVASGHIFSGWDNYSGDRETKPFASGINAIMGAEDYDGVCPPGATRLTDCDCAVQDFAAAPLRKLKSVSDYASVKYIDPTFAGSPKLGTETNPYSSWSDFTIAENTAYLFKRGTTISSSAYNIPITPNNVLLGAYDTGARPQIIADGLHSIFRITGDLCTVRDLHLQIPDMYLVSRTAHSGVQMVGAINVDIYNCDMQYMPFGLRSESALQKSVRVIGCTIHNTNTEGMYIMAEYLEVAWTDIHDINEWYFGQPEIHVNGGTNNGSTGDGIEIYGNWRNMYVHHTIIDHGTTGNKGTIMFHTPTTFEKAIIEYSILVAPIQGSTPVQLINTKGGIVLRNNLLFGSAIGPKTTGVYSWPGNDSIIGNVFVGFQQAMYTDPTNTIISNNTFYDNTYCFYSPSTKQLKELRNNIFWNNTNKYYNITVLSESKNLDTNPNFVNPTNDPYNNDFTLQSTSAAINEGTLLSYRKYDINGTTVPHEATDIGAYEYVSGLPTSVLIPNERQAFLPVISPNPFRNELRISNTEHVSRVELINMSGKTLVIRQNPKASEIMIGTESIRSGIYILRLFDGTGAVSVFKVVK